MNISKKYAWLEGAFKFASIGSLGCIIVFLITWWVGADPLGNWKIVASVPCFLTAYLAIKKYRDLHTDGIIKLSSAYLYGLYINALIGLFTGVFVFIFLQFVDPTLVSTHVEYLKEFIKVNPAYKTEAKVTLIADVEKTTAFNLGVDEWLKRVGSGFFYVLLAAAILRK
jgi:hypothetical protein